MQVIPAINCKNFKCVKERLLKASEFLPKSGWIQIDISDGKFTKAKTWNEPKELRELRIKKKELKGIKFEIHLMVRDWEKEAEKWLKAGADRVVVHLEAIKKVESGKWKGKRKYKTEIGIAINPATPVEKLVPYLNRIKLVQLLAVKPGYSGQKFDKKIVEKIKFLKKNFPKIAIEIDGGMDVKTAKLVKKAGTDIIVSGSYIFNSKKPKISYKNLTSV